MSEKTPEQINRRSSEPDAWGAGLMAKAEMMRRYDNPEITPFIPGRGRVMVVPKGEEPDMYEVVLVKFEDRFVPKRVVGLEMTSGGCRLVGVVLRDPDFPDPVVWEE